MTAGANRQPARPRRAHDDAVPAPARARTAPTERRPGEGTSPERLAPADERGSSRRTAVLIAGAAVAVVAVIVLAIVMLGGSSSSKNPKSTPVSTVVKTAKKSSSAHAKKSTQSSTSTTTPPANAAETTVAVLNGTETTGLAHRVSIALQRRGYSQANALNGRPPGSGQETVVEYAGGHQAEAEGVARSLTVKQVQPLEAAAAGLAGSAQVVVIVGANTTVP